MTADDDTLPVGRWLGGMTPSYAHLPTLALLRRHVYVPSVFAQEGKQPLRVLPPYDETHEVSGGLPASLDDLRTQNTAVDGYLRDWPQHFDYVLVRERRRRPRDGTRRHMSGQRPRLRETLSRRGALSG